MLGGELRRESGWGGVGYSGVGQGYTVLVCTSDSDDDMVKNSGMASCENKTHKGPRLGGGNVRACVRGTFCSHVEDQGADAPSKEWHHCYWKEAGRGFYYSYPKSSHASVFPACSFWGSLNEYSSMYYGNNPHRILCWCTKVTDARQRYLFGFRNPSK